MEKPKLLYDGVCNFCRGVVRLLNRIDKQKKIQLIAIQEFASNDSSIIPQDYNSVVFIDKKQIYIKSEAAFKVIETVGGFYKILLVFKFLPHRFLDFIYDIVARNRYRIFGKSDACSY